MWRASESKRAKAFAFERDFIAQQKANGRVDIGVSQSQDQIEKLDATLDGVTYQLILNFDSKTVWVEHTDENGNPGKFRIKPGAHWIVWRLLNGSELTVLKREVWDLVANLNWNGPIASSKTCKTPYTPVGRNYRLGNRPPIPDKMCRVPITDILRLPSAKLAP